MVDGARGGGGGRSADEIRGRLVVSRSRSDDPDPSSLEAIPQDLQALRCGGAGRNAHLAALVVGPTQRLRYLRLRNSADIATGPTKVYGSVLSRAVLSFAIHLRTDRQYAPRSVVLRCLCAVARKAAKSLSLFLPLLPSLSDEQLGSSLDKKTFLLTMGLLPFAISIALSALRQQYIHSLWGLFYWNLTGVMLFYFCRNTITQQTIRRRLPVFFALWGGLVLLSTVGVLTLPFVASPRQAWLFDGPYQVQTKPIAQKRSAIDALLGRSERQSRAQQENQAQESLDEESRALPRVAMPPSLRPFFDGRLLASKVAEGWSNEGYPPLSVVGGGWLATNVSFFATSKPAVVTLFDSERTAWLSHHREEWREQGGVLLWFARHQDEGLPLRYRQALRGRPYALQQPFVVEWRRIFGVEVRRVRGVAAPLIGWVFVPPLASPLWRPPLGQEG